jgi:hypothetical protein
MGTSRNPGAVRADLDSCVGSNRSRLHLTPGTTSPWQIFGYRVPIRAREKCCSPIVLRTVGSGHQSDLADQLEPAEN